LELPIEKKFENTTKIILKELQKNTINSKVDQERQSLELMIINDQKENFSINLCLEYESNNNEEHKVFINGEFMGKSEWDLIHDKSPAIITTDKIKSYCYNQSNRGTVQASFF